MSLAPGTRLGRVLQVVTSTDRRGGAGTVYLFGATATYGDLVVDNGIVAGVSTEMPALPPPT